MAIQRLFYTIGVKANHKATIVYELDGSPEKANEWRTDGNKLYTYFDTDILLHAIQRD